MFLDEVFLRLVAGKGGDGYVSFFRQKFQPRGGPDGGDGGKGGDIFIVSDQNLASLDFFSSCRKFSAENGKSGEKNRRHGKAGQDLILSVPVGTQIFDDSENLLFDFSENKIKFLVARGGRGGFGNAHFCTSVRQSPKFAELGEPGEIKNIKLELKLLADIGIIGIPSAGKSTLLSVISDARPKIGDFPFTTIVPNLGIAKLSNNRRIIFCDIPGLISGAAKGKGLGHKFLRHISRNLILIHLIDISANNPVKNFLEVRKEIELFSQKISQIPEIIVFSKIDLYFSDRKKINLIKENFSKKIGISPENILEISSVTKKGIDNFLQKVWQQLEKTKHFLDKKQNIETSKDKDFGHKIFRPNQNISPRNFQILVEKNGFRISGKRIEQIAIQTDFKNNEAVARLRDIFRKTGIEKELIKKGAEFGTPIFLGEKKINFRPKIL